MKNPDRWLSSTLKSRANTLGQAESEVLKIKNLFDLASPNYTHAQLLKVIEMLCTNTPMPSKGPGT